MGSIVMGLFSGLGSMFGLSSRDSRRAIGQARDEEIGFLNQGVEEFRRINEPLIAARDQGNEGLMNFFGGDQSMVLDLVNNSPFLEQMKSIAQERVLDQSGPMGLTRSGNTGEAVDESNRGVFQSLVNQMLSGFTNLASNTPDASGIANLFSRQGRVTSDATIAQEQASQNAQGRALQFGANTGLGKELLEFFSSDRRLKTNIEPKGVESGHKTYTWDWNKLANELGMKGSAYGVIADEVKKINPEAVMNFGGYDFVNYEMIGVSHGSI